MFNVPVHVEATEVLELELYSDEFTPKVGREMHTTKDRGPAVMSTFNPEPHARLLFRCVGNTSEPLHEGTWISNLRCLSSNFVLCRQTRVGSVSRFECSPHHSVMFDLLSDTSEWVYYHPYAAAPFRCLQQLRG